MSQVAFIRVEKQLLPEYQKQMLAMASDSTGELTNLQCKFKENAWLYLTEANTLMHAHGLEALVATLVVSRALGSDAVNLVCAADQSVVDVTNINTNHSMFDYPGIDEETKIQCMLDAGLIRRPLGMLIQDSLVGGHDAIL